MTVQEAINHYEYGITHDIFSEPVTTYAKMAVEALEKQIPKKPIHKIKRPNSLYGVCPVCGRRLVTDKYCPRCGHALKWGEEDD